MNIKTRSSRLCTPSNLELRSSKILEVLGVPKPSKTDLGDNRDLLGVETKLNGFLLVLLPLPLFQLFQLDEETLYQTKRNKKVVIIEVPTAKR